MTTEQPTDAQIEAAQRAVMNVDRCGLTIEGERVLCDDPRADPQFRADICECKESGKAALLAAFQLIPARDDELRKALEPFAEIATRLGWDKLPDDHGGLYVHVLEAPADGISPGAVYCLQVSEFRQAALALSPPQSVRPNAEGEFKGALSRVLEHEYAEECQECAIGQSSAWEEAKRILSSTPIPPRATNTEDQVPSEDELAQVLYYNNYTAKRPWDQALEPYKSEAQADASAVYDFLIKRLQAGERE